MSTKLVISTEDVKAWAPAQDMDDDAALQRCVRAASSLLESSLGLRIVAQDTDDTEIHDGLGPAVIGRYNERLRLDRAPVISVTSITENGVALTHATGYDTAADVILDAKRGLLIRQTLPENIPLSATGQAAWAPGVQNVTVVYKPGLAATTDVVPEDLAQLCAEIAWLIYKGGATILQASTSRGGKSHSWTRELSPVGQLVFDQYRSLRLAG